MSSCSTCDGTGWFWQPVADRRGVDRFRHACHCELGWHWYVDGLRADAARLRRGGGLDLSIIPWGRKYDDGSP